MSEGAGENGRGDDGVDNDASAVVEEMGSETTEGATAATAAKEAGWCLPAETSGKLADERGMRSVKNVKGVSLSGFRPKVLSLKQWARVRESDDTVGEMAVGHAVRAVSLRGLERVAMTEVWPEGMMESYLDAQFLRSIEQGKMVQCYTEGGDAAWAVFHTNLLSYDEFALYAMFCREFRQEEEWSEEGSNDAPNGEKWELCGFMDDIALRDPSQPWNAIEPILHIPPRATFIDDPTDQLWMSTNDDDDVILEIDTKFWTSIETKADLVFPNTVTTPSDRQRAGMNAVQRLARLVSFSYHTPTLRFARLQGQRGPGKVQMLLPLKVDPRSMHTQGAVVVDIIKSRRGGRMYRAVGVISFKEALFTARIVGPLKSDWLNISSLKDPRTDAANIVEKEKDGDKLDKLGSSADDEKPAYASIANKPVVDNDEVKLATKSSNGLFTQKKIDDWYKATVAEAVPKITNPKVNLKMLPFDFMQAVCRKLRVDDRILRLSDEPSESERRLIQTVSTEASMWVRNIMSCYGTVSRVFVGVSKHVRCFFAVVSYAEWTDTAVRDALVQGDIIQANGFRCREKVYMRLSLQDKRELV